MLSPLVLLQPAKGRFQTRQRSADGWKEFINPIVERYLKLAVRLLFRADAAFAKPEIYEYLETRIGYAIRLPANEVLQKEIAHLLVRPTEWPSQKPIVSYHDFVYQARMFLEESGQGGVASGRTVPKSRLHRNQPELSNEGNSQLLQWQRHSRAVD